MLYTNRKETTDDRFRRPGSEKRFTTLAFRLPSSTCSSAPPSRRAKRYRAVVPVDARVRTDLFAIVTDRYCLIRNEDVTDLGHEAFERLFGSHRHTQMTVFNVVMAKGLGIKDIIGNLHNGRAYSVVTDRTVQLWMTERAMATRRTLRVCYTSVLDLNCVGL